MTDLQAFNAEDVQNNWCIFNLKPLPKSPEVCLFICSWVCEINNKKTSYVKNTQSLKPRRSDLRNSRKSPFEDNLYDFIFDKLWKPSQNG